MTFPRTCVCSHPEGDHKSSGTRFPHPPRFGVCLVRGCTCLGFVADEEQERAEAWLTDVGDAA